MKITEAKQQIDFYTDVIYQQGFDLGWNAVLEDMENLADKLWNRGDSATGQSLRDIIKTVRDSK
tara:strand:+ start:373 stop:564 length:192 start_codon:yes stop_codon:yes gene_type:complete